jgi:hypothetical protein
MALGMFDAGSLLREQQHVQSQNVATSSLLRDEPPDTIQISVGRPRGAVSVLVGRPGAHEKSAMDRSHGDLREKDITNIEITTTQAVDVEQLARDIRASIGLCSITMHAVMTNTCDVPLLRRCGMSCECEVIVHINRAVPVKTDEDDNHVPPIAKIKNEDEDENQPPAKIAKISRWAMPANRWLPE